MEKRVKRKLTELVSWKKQEAKAETAEKVKKIRKSLFDLLHIFLIKDWYSRKE